MSRPFLLTPASTPLVTPAPNHIDYYRPAQETSKAIGHTCRASAATSAGPTKVCSSLLYKPDMCTSVCIIIPEHALFQKPPAWPSGASYELHVGPQLDQGLHYLPASCQKANCYNVHVYNTMHSQLGVLMGIFSCAQGDQPSLHRRDAAAGRLRGGSRDGHQSLCIFRNHCSR